MRLEIAILLVSFNYLQCSFGERSKENARIVIIGAGPSGIAAASKLFENGFKNVTILEAENRIGGRVFTTKFGDYLVDMGAQYIAGVEGNVAYELGNPLGLVDASNETYNGLSEILYDSQGNLINKNISDQVFALSFNDLYEAKFENVTLFQSLGDYTEKLFDQRFKDVPEIMNDKQKYLFHLEMIAISEAATDSWNDLSLEARNEYRDCPGDDMANWKNLGWSTVLE